MMTNEPIHLRLAGVTRLHLGAGRGPRDVFVFDPHRLAMSCWALVLGEGPGALLVTLDRHLDLVPPARASEVPPASAGVRKIDEFARWELDVRNYDHILASMEAGLISDAIVIARSRPQGCLASDTYVDSRGQPHRLLIVPTVDRVAADFHTHRASPEARLAQSLLEASQRLVLDIDLDCFTTVSDADPTTTIPWPASVIRDHLLPPGSEAFWEEVLRRAVCLTLAREPAHCGGLLGAGHLLESLSKPLFEELFQTESP